LQHLADMKKLTHLDLHETFIEGPGLRHLSGMKDLVYLNLSSTNLRGANLARLTGLPLKTLLCEDTAINDADAQHLVALQALEKLDLNKTNVTDTALRQLKSLPKLRDLLVSGTGITAAGRDEIFKSTTISLSAYDVADKPAAPGDQVDPEPADTPVVKLNRSNNELLRRLSTFKSTEELNIDRYIGSDFGLSHLKHLSKLRVIHFTDSRVGDVGLEYLAAVPSLKHISLGPRHMIDTGQRYFSVHHITDAGVNALKPLVNLESLELPSTRIGDEGLRVLSAFAKIQTLDLSRSLVTDAGLKALSKSPALQRLNVSYCPGITDASLETIKEIPGLKTVSLKGTKVTKDAVESLRKQMPDLMIDI
jgi:F-box and leucine-rich repeat protein 14